jgi:hypothetical protein
MGGGSLVGGYMSDSNPRIGEATPLYPFGYAFCQCGCGHITKLNPDGVWASYIEGHESTWKPSNADMPQEDKLTKQLDIQFVEDQVTRSTVESVSSKQLSSPSAKEKEDFIGLKGGVGGVRVIDPATLKAGERLPRITIKESPPSLSRKSFVAPDRPLLELYMDLVRKHEILELQMKAACLNLENATTLIKNLWTGSASGKELVIEKLQAVLI